MKKTVEFLGKDRNKVSVEIEITTRNGYRELTMCGNYGNGLGQIYDNIKPASKPQKELLKLWKKYHLKSVEKVKSIEQKINTIIDDIEKEDRKSVV